MSEFNTQVEEIQSLITSISKTDKSFGYSNLLHLQEQSTQHPPVIHSLLKCLYPILSSTISDISDDDEEIAAQALKCLGFMIYHPSLVSSVPEEVAQLVVECLVKLITTTKMKAVCNLGVWCISIQQFSPSFLANNFHPLLRAVIHALDNPIGSLSTTFEATQAVLKLVTQLSERMRDTSNIWAPVIYRRLLTTDKRERDMADRCLLKIRHVIYPPPLALSKAVVSDMKKTLLSEMKEVLQDHERKVHTIQAWGWYIRLLGSYALKNRQLVNEMLKIPEQTFSDSDPQVQIASQVAWEGLIDALIHPSLEPPEMNMALGHPDQERGPMMLNKCNSDKTADGLPKSLRLIMTPLLGILSSKCDISVRSSCLKTWCYLLHKLDLSVNCPSVRKSVLEPILEVVFQVETDDKSMWLWNYCLDLLDDLVSACNRGRDYNSSQQVSRNSSTKTSSLRPNNSSKSTFNDYPIKWLPWDLSKLDIHLKVIRILISQGSVTALTPEYRILACDGALRAFRSVLKGIQMELKKSSISYSEVMLCLNAILSLTKMVCDDATLREFNELIHTSFQFIEAIREELEPSLLASPLYKVPLDIKYINDMESVIGTEDPEVPEISCIKYMDMASPTVCLTILQFSMVAQSVQNASRMDIILQVMKKHLKLILSSCNPLEDLNAIICILYKHWDLAWLKIWVIIANDLKEHIDGVKDTPFLKTEMDGDGCLAVCWFLSYPFMVCLHPQNLLSSDLSLLCPQVNLKNIVEVWKSLYGSVKCYAQREWSTMTTFHEDLCGILNKVLNKNPDGDTDLLKDKNQNLVLQHLCGEVAICLLTQLSDFDNEALSAKVSDADFSLSNSIRNSLEFIARYLRLSLGVTVRDAETDLSVTIRVLSAMTGFIAHLRMKHHILSLMEICSDPLVQWLSIYAPMHVEMQEGSIVCQLELLWSEMINSLERSQPSITFDSSFLKVLAPVLKATLDHANSAISKSTIIFWNRTYGNRVKLDYPQSLLPVLDKLSRKGKISIQKRSLSYLVNGHSTEVMGAPLGYKVAATQNKISKRIEFTENKSTDCEGTDKVVHGSKRKKLELTEHQKEVRRAQQGRGRDCCGHGPGIRTYTSVDFSQANEDSQESQELRNPEAILEMLRKAL